MMANSLQNKCLLICFSESGEVLEVNILAKLAQKMDFTVVGVSSQKKSSLAKYVDYMLLIDSLDYHFSMRTSATDALPSLLLVANILFYHYTANHYEEVKENIMENRKTLREFNNPRYW